MKTIYQAICAGLIVCGALTSCNKFIDVEPKGVISEGLAMSQLQPMPNLATTGILIRLTCGLMATFLPTMP